MEQILPVTIVNGCVYSDNLATHNFIWIRFPCFGWWLTAGPAALIIIFARKVPEVVFVLANDIDMRLFFPSDDAIPDDRFVLYLFQETSGVWLQEQEKPIVLRLCCYTPLAGI